MIFIGIDPGLSGGVAALTIAGKLILADCMPVVPAPIPGKRWVDAAALRRLLVPTGIAERVAAVERVGAMPGQGVSSSFGFGQSFGIVLGVLGAMGIGVELPVPQRWKKHHGLIKADKRASVGIVARRWPDLNLKASDDGIAEAILIADYLRSTYQTRRRWRSSARSSASVARGLPNS